MANIYRAETCSCIPTVLPGETQLCSTARATHNNPLLLNQHNGDGAPQDQRRMLLNSPVTGIIKLYNYHSQFSIILKCTEGTEHIFAATGVGKER